MSNCQISFNFMSSDIRKIGLNLLAFVKRTQMHPRFDYNTWLQITAPELVCNSSHTGSYGNSCRTVFVQSGNMNRSTGWENWAYFVSPRALFNHFTVSFSETHMWLWIPVVLVWKHQIPGFQSLDFIPNEIPCYSMNSMPICLVINLTFWSK